MPQISTWEDRIANVPATICLTQLITGGLDFLYPSIPLYTIYQRNLILASPLCVQPRALHNTPPQTTASTSPVDQDQSPLSANRVCYDQYTDVTIQAGAFVYSAD